MSYSVYKHTFPNGKVYIGITCQKPRRRWQYGYGYYTQSLMYNAIQKYGWNNMLHEILYEGLTKEEAEQKEIELISIYKSNQREFGYNIANGGNTKGSVSNETKIRMSKSQIGRKVSDETRKKLSLSHIGKMTGENNPNFGKSLPESTRKKISEANKGKTHYVSKEVRDRISEKHKGKKLSEETRKKISEAFKGEKHPFYGKHFSDEHKERIGKANSKAVRCVETNVVYYGATDASRKTGINRSAITMTCKGTHKTAGGYHWEYVEK